MTTKVNQARISAPIVINNAEAKVNATLATNLATVQSYYQVTKSASAAYKKMKTDLAFTNRQLLDFIRQKIVGAYNKDNLVNTIPSKVAMKRSGSPKVAAPQPAPTPTGGTRR